MGGGRWDDDAYYSIKGAGGYSSFDHDSRARKGIDPPCHKKMDARGAIRESRDSKEHPESLAIQVFFDVTGSMGGVPIALQQKMGNLMELVLRKGYIEHPQILFGAIGDATCDDASLQVGQFESDVRMHEDLTRIYLEGGGGGHITESYELALYFAARHTAIDCWEKRGKKGYLFLIGDETPYSLVKKNEVKGLIGDTLQKDIPVEEIIAEAGQKYHIFFIVPTMTSNGKHPLIRQKWEELLGKENVLMLQDADEAADLIAATIGITEGRALDDVARDVAVVSSDKTAKNISGALAKYAAKTGEMAKAENLPPSRASRAKRL